MLSFSAIFSCGNVMLSAWAVISFLTFVHRRTFILCGCDTCVESVCRLFPDSSSHRTLGPLLETLRMRTPAEGETSPVVFPESLGYSFLWLWWCIPAQRAGEWARKLQFCLLICPHICKSKYQHFSFYFTIFFMYLFERISISYT